MYFLTMKYLWNIEKMFTLLLFCSMTAMMMYFHQFLYV